MKWDENAAGKHLLSDQIFWCCGVSRHCFTHIPAFLFHHPHYPRMQLRPSEGREEPFTALSLPCSLLSGLALILWHYPFYHQRGALCKLAVASLFVLEKFVFKMLIQVTPLGPEHSLIFCCTKDYVPRFVLIAKSMILVSVMADAQKAFWASHLRVLLLDQYVVGCLLTKVNVVNIHVACIAFPPVSRKIRLPLSTNFGAGSWGGSTLSQLLPARCSRCCSRGLI